MEMDDMSGELYDDVSMEGESELTQFLSRGDEPTLALATEEDVTLDMEIELDRSG